MRIAIPIWGDRISPVLDTASRLLVVEVEEEREASRYEIFLDEHEPTRRCLRIRGMDVDLLICGAVSRPFFRMLTASGISVIPDISGHPEDVLKAYLHDRTLHSGFWMPGCRRRGEMLEKDGTCRRKQQNRKQHSKSRSSEQKEQPPD